MNRRGLTTYHCSSDCCDENIDSSVSTLKNARTSNLVKSYQVRNQFQRNTFKCKRKGQALVHSGKKDGIYLLSYITHNISKSKYTILTV